MAALEATQTPQIAEYNRLSAERFMKTLDAHLATRTFLALDRFTIADIAGAAGVSGQTITNHFGSKDNLYLTGVSERFVPRVNEIRAGVTVGDIASIVDAVLAGYEESGESTTSA